MHDTASAACAVVCPAQGVNYCLLLATALPTAHAAGLAPISIVIAALDPPPGRAEPLSPRRLIPSGYVNSPAYMADPLGDGFDLVTGTPPYLRIGEGVESGRPQLAPCHFEHRGGLEAYCQAASRIVAPGGTLVLCAGAAQHQRMLDAAHAAGFAVASWLPVVPRQGKTPLFSVYAMRQSDGRAQSHPPLVVRDAAGRRTPPFLRVRRDMGMPP